MTDYLLNDGKPIKGYYIYGWVNADWGGAYFYIGKGTNDRYKKISNRGRAFKAIISNWDCFPVIIEDGLTEEEAILEEDRIKTEMLFNLGYPIVDGEGHSAWIKNKAILLAKKERKENDPTFKEGRPKKFSKQQMKLALALLENYSYKQVEEMTGISISTLARAKRAAICSSN